MYSSKILANIMSTLAIIIIIKKITCVPLLYYEYRAICRGCSSVIYASHIGSFNCV